MKSLCIGKNHNRAGMFVITVLLSLCLCGCGSSGTVKKVDSRERVSASSETGVSESLEMTGTLESAEASEPLVSVKASYIAEDGSIVRMSEDELALKEDAVAQVIAALPKQKMGAALTQDDLDDATVQWFNTCYALLTYQNANDFTLIGGRTNTAENRKKMCNVLESDWSVTDRTSAIETLQWLLESGHRAGYEQTIEEFENYGLLDLSLEEYMAICEQSVKKQNADFEELAPYFKNIYQAYQNCGDVGVKAWDYCRIMQLCGSYYVAGYFSLQESMEVSLATAQLLQAEFLSWDDLLNSYLHGYYYWRGDDPEQDGSGSSLRLYYYNKLCELDENPYAVNAWDTEFVINWR